jgi:hypothetical protein
VSTYTVTGVRKSWRRTAGIGISRGYVLAAARITPRQAVADSIDAGNTWKTKADGYEATIVKVSFCPAVGCLAKPYLRTKPDSTKKDNLENLDPC